ncbi:hypothetical protein [Pseudomonas farris]
MKFTKVLWLIFASALLILLALGADWIALRQSSPPDMSPSPIDDTLASLPRGSAAITAPGAVEQYQEFEVLLRLTTEDLTGLLNTMKSEGSPSTVVKGISGVRMSQRMKAELLGNDFAIEDKGPKEQAVTLNEETVWSWRAYSETQGNHSLRVRLYTLLQVDGHETQRTIDVGEVIVSVTVSPLKWMQRHWEFIATGLLIPFFGWVCKRFLEAEKKIE